MKPIKIISAIAFIFLFKLQLHSQNTPNNDINKILSNADNDTLKCQLLMNVIDEETNDDVWPRYNAMMKELCEKNIAKSNLNKTERETFLSYLGCAKVNEGYLMAMRGNSKDAIKFYEQALEIRTGINEYRGMMECFTNLGDEYMAQVNYMKALDYYNKSLSIAKQLKDKKGLAFNYNSIGLLYSDQGRLNLALENYMQSLKYAIEDNNTNHIATVYTNIAVVYNSFDNIDMAFEYFQKALDIHRQLKNDYGLHTSLNNIGYIYNKKQKYKEAIECFNQSLEYADKIAYIHGKGLALQNRGASYFYLNNNAEALKNYEEALKIRQEVNDKSGTAITLNSIGAVHFRKGNYAKCIEYNLQSLKISKEIQMPQNIRDASERLYKVYKKTNRPDEALEMYEQFIVMRDSIKNENTRKLALKSQFQIEFDQKEREVKQKAEAEKLFLQQKSDQEKKQRNIILYSVLTGLVLVVIFSIFLFRSLQQNKKAREIISIQKNEVEESRKEILDSIQYAKRIQYALLAGDKMLQNNLQDYFILFQPKDVVSGDFYWATPTPEGFLYITADCTGHGVPGAFMSLLNISKLNQAVIENRIYRPDNVLNYVRDEIIKALNPEDASEESKDGMDATLCLIDREKRTLKYAAAHNSFCIIRNNEIIHCKADKMPVGKGHDDKLPFTYNEIELQKGDTIYTFTDGYADQFGGPKGKKFKYRQLEELLIRINTLSTYDQKSVLQSAFKEWKGDLEQIDDICIIGIRV